MSPRPVHPLSPPSPPSLNQPLKQSTDPSSLHSAMKNLRPLSAPPRLCRRGFCLGLLIVPLVTFSVIYINFFHRGPTSSILEANGMVKTRHRPVGGDDYEFFEQDDGMEAQLPDGSERMWERFVARNKFVSIGDQWTSCNKTSKRIQVGKTVLIATPSGRLLTKTFINITLRKAIYDGTLAADVKYNGKDLYQNKWPLCGVDADSANRIVRCPFKVGHHRLYKPQFISSVLPRGTYVIRLWLTDQDDELFLCSYIKLVL